MARPASVRRFRHTPRRRLEETLHWSGRAVSLEDVRWLLTEQARFLRAAFRCGEQLQRCCAAGTGRTRTRRSLKRCAQATSRRSQQQPCVIRTGALQESQKSALGGFIGSTELLTVEQTVGAETLPARRVQLDGLPVLCEAPVAPTMDSPTPGNMSWLSAEDTLSLLFGAGFRGDDLEWMDTFERLCNEAGGSPSGGVRSSSFVQLLMDDLARRCEHTSVSLQEMLRVARRAPTREPEFPAVEKIMSAAPAAKKLTLPCARSPGNGVPACASSELSMLSMLKQDEECLIKRRERPTESMSYTGSPACTKLRQEAEVLKKESTLANGSANTLANGKAAPIQAKKKQVRFDPIPVARPECDDTSWGDVLRDVFIM